MISRASTPELYLILKWRRALIFEAGKKNLKTGPHIEVEAVSLSAQVSTGLEEQLNPNLHSNLTADDIML